MPSPSERELRRLLILSCSARKRPATDKVLAWDLYDGVAYRVVKRVQRCGQFPADVDIVIISAKYGVIGPQEYIESYDLRMNANIAKTQAPENRADLRNILLRTNYREVFVIAGETYIMSLEPLESWLIPGTLFGIAEGGIGKKNAALKAWLSASNA